MQRELSVKLLIILALLAGSFVTASCSSNESASTDVVARVNGKDITTADLDKQFQSRVSGAEQQPAAEEVPELKLQLLSQMINDQILLALAGEAALTATDAEVDVKFNEFKGQYTEEKFQELLAQQKTTVENIKAELRKTITLDKLVNKEITSKISVSEAEIKGFYDKNKASFNLPESYRIAHILVTPVVDPAVQNTQKDDAKTPAEAQQKAQRLLRQIQGGAEFATVAQQFSEDPTSAPNGGDLSFQPLQALEGIDPRLTQVVQRMKPGETFPQVVETRFGYHVVKLIERDAGGQKDLTDPRVQADVRQVIFNRKDQTLKAAFSETIRNKAEISNFLAQRMLESAGQVQP